mmetsp:Transcript_9637/g.26241  ORF Transcript_9637/g.26241 Transcript_9637/m.26241 type:complete len:234 (-) Transcript_9637:180-881(-)
MLFSIISCALRLIPAQNRRLGWLKCDDPDETASISHLALDSFLTDSVRHPEIASFCSIPLPLQPRCHRYHRHHDRSRSYSMARSTGFDINAANIFHAQCPLFAHCNGVRPCLPRAWRSVVFSVTRYLTTSKQPAFTARCNTVSPSPSVMFTSTFTFGDFTNVSIFATRILPSSLSFPFSDGSPSAPLKIQTQCNAVSPLLFRNVASTESHPIRFRRTKSSPFSHTRWRSVVPS